jgi:hypothetical protein
MLGIQQMLKTKSLNTNDNFKPIEELKPEYDVTLNLVH